MYTSCNTKREIFNEQDAFYNIFSTSISTSLSEICSHSIVCNGVLQSHFCKVRFFYNGLVDIDDN